MREDQKAKETAALEDTGEAGGDFHRHRGLNDPARQGSAMGKHSEAAGRWLAQPSRRKASIPRVPGGHACGGTASPPAPSVLLALAPRRPRPRSRLRAWGGAPAPGEEEDGAGRMETGEPQV